jgi:spore coat polysaccharide biosynthesis predicted glycosyltransferase SpsG/RimJ/RimL family protein N-acetyltransferase
VPGGVAFRCDGDARVGAGHVARCLQIALAFRAAGTEVVFCGNYDGIAADLLAADEMATAPAEAATGTSAVVVDSYEIPASEIEALARELPTAALVDDTEVPATVPVLSYHLDSPERIEAAGVALLGADYAPVRPQLIARRQVRGFTHLLVTAGATAPADVLEAIARVALEKDGLEVLVAGGSALGIDDPRLRQETFSGGLLEPIAWADAAVTAAGTTPYDLACAGVPSLLFAIADNQFSTMRPFVDFGVALGLDARDGVPAEELRTQLARLAHEHEQLAAAGPRVIDGYGAYRARDGLTAAFEGAEPPRVIRYRPATAGDAELLLEWRNDDEVRAVSRNSEVVGPDEHADWLDSVIADPLRTLFIAEAAEGEPVAQVRFDRTGEEAEISVSVAASRRGGIGAQVIAESSELFMAAYPDVKAISAQVKAGNDRSHAAFDRAGYKPAGDNEFGPVLVRRIGRA